MAKKKEHEEIQNCVLHRNIAFSLKFFEEKEKCENLRAENCAGIGRRKFKARPRRLDSARVLAAAATRARADEARTKERRRCLFSERGGMRPTEGNKAAERKEEKKKNDVNKIDENQSDLGILYGFLLVGAWQFGRKMSRWNDNVTE